MACSMRDVIDPETISLVTYESSIKSGTHGEVYQKQLALTLLLRLSREEKHFRLAYELTSADKFDDVVLYDKTAKKWIFLQSKHAEGKESKIDRNGLLPETNREKGDFSLYKYFISYMKIRNRFKGKVNMLLFTNKKLDEKLKTVEDFVAIRDRDVDEYLRFTTESATQKQLIPSESTIQSIMEYTNNDLYSLKDAIKQLFSKGIISDQLLKYKVYLNDVLKESKNFEIRFKNTFNDSLIFIAELYKILQSELYNLKPIAKPPGLDIKDMEYEYANLSWAGVQDVVHLPNAIEILFRKGIVSDILKKYEQLLALVLTTTANGLLAFKNTFNSDVVSKAELYRMLKAELSDMNKVVTTKQKLFDGKDSRNKHHSVLFYAEESDVKQFFALLTLSVGQPDELEPFIIEELNSWMRMWLRPDNLGMLTEHDDKNAVKDFDDYFESTLKCGKGNSKPYLDQRFVSQFYNNLQSKLVEQYPKLKYTNQIYINRVLIFENEDIHKTKYSQDPQINEYLKFKPYPFFEELSDFDCETIESELEMCDTIALSNTTYKKMTDIQFAENLCGGFSQYQCLVLTANPGIGKTELLQYVAFELQKLKSGKVFLFYLNRIQDCYDVLENESSLNILKSALSRKNFELVQNILENVSKDYFTILFDGYDEIHGKNRNKINNLFKLLLKSKHIQLVISVRNHEKKSLQRFLQEHKLNVGYFSLESFNSENIIEYLAQSWNENVKCDENLKFKTYSKFLIDKFYGLCRVPLMVKMMAKIYKQRFEQFRDTSMIDEISYLEKEFLEVGRIYEIFIETCLLVKIEDACHGIGKVDPNKQICEGFYLDHQLLAIKCLDISELEFIFKNPKYMKKWDCIQKSHRNLLEKSILLSFVDGKVSFSHHSYAEYFVATFLWDDFINLKSIIKNVLSVFKGIRTFFIKIIEKKFELFVSGIGRETSFVSRDVVLWACESDAEKLLKYVLSKIYLFRPSEAKLLHIAIKNNSENVFHYLMFDLKVHPDAKYDGGLAPLHTAVIYGHENLVQLLLFIGADINVRNTEGWSALHYSVQHKRIAITKLLIENGIEINSINKNKWSALHISCNNGDVDMTKMLLQKCTQPDMKTNEGKTPLDLAASKEYTEIIDIFIEQHIMKFPLHKIFQAAVCNGYHSIIKKLIKEFPELAGGIDFVEKPIHIAAQEGNMKKVKEFIINGENVNALNELRRTALHLGASAGHRHVVELLLEKGANINAVDEHNVTPLYLACQNDNIDVVETLIKRGAKIDALTHNKWTTLHESAFMGHYDIVNLLLDNGVNVNAVDENNVAPLYLACQNGHKEVVKILTRRGANINALTGDNRTALHISASEGYWVILNILLEKGANIGNEHDVTPLFLACQNGHQEVVRILIGRGANIHALARDKRTVLHVAASNGHYIIVDILLREGVNINAVDENYVTPHYLACQNGHEEVVQTLIRRGANIGALTYNKWTALHVSAYKGHYDIVELLLDNGANVNAVNEDDVTPLYLACQNGHSDVVNILIRRGANVEALTIDNRTALHVSASEGYSDIVIVLLRRGANVNVVDVNYETPIYLACKKGHIDVVETLIKRNANIEALTHIKWTALHVSAYEGHEVIADLLLNEEANVNAVDEINVTPLYLACQKGHRYIAETLIRKHANIEALAYNKWTALHVSAYEGHYDIVDLLLDKGANENAVDESGMTPLYLASQNGHEKVVKILVRGGANIEIFTRTGWTALHVSAYEDHCIIVDLLLDGGADVNAVDEDDVTPLYLACQNGHKKVAETLIRRGANINKLTRDNRTALHVSASNGYSGIVDILLKNDAISSTVDKKGHTPMSSALKNGHQHVVKLLCSLYSL